jgi:hypothetical protein
MPRRYCARNVPTRERRLEGLAVAVLTALGERDAAVRDAERRAGEALQTMTDDEGLSLREAVDWLSSPDRADAFVYAFPYVDLPEVDVEIHADESITGDLNDQGLVTSRPSWMRR